MALVPNKTRNILIAPLDWGLGHATRCVPIVHYFLEKGHHVILAASGKSLAFLQNEFPQLPCLKIPDYNITYTAKGKFLALKMLWQVPKILMAISREHKQLKDIVKSHNIHLVVSDNRYGFWHKTVPCIFMTHQLMIKMPKSLGLVELLSHKITASFVRKYTYCFVPDFEGNENLSGNLSHKYKPLNNTFFIGPLSRFKLPTKCQSDKEWDILVILSGPEPQRSIFENIIMSQIKNTGLKTIVLRGLPDSNTPSGSFENTKVYAHLPSRDIEVLINKTSLVIARSGYSTIMDLVALNAKAVLVPTPGQTEQSYLAHYHHKKGFFMMAKQETFNLSEILEKTARFPFKSFSKKTPTAIFNTKTEQLLNEILSNNNTSEGYVI